MKKIKSIVSMLMAFVLVLACVQMLGVTEVEAAGASVTVYNAQYVSIAEMEKAMGAEATEEDLNSKIYIVNDATVIDTSFTSADEALYVVLNITDLEGGYATPKTYYELNTAKRIGVGQDLKSNSANAAEVEYGDGYYYIFVSQTLAKQMGLSVQGTRTDNATCTMHRLYNPNSGEHFYTANDVEKNNLVSLGWKYEGTGWTAPAYSGTPVYRLYNPNAGDHHYTTNANEKNYLVSMGWNDEGIGWYSNELGTATLHRLYNPNATGAGAHHYTTNAAEATNLQNLGWRYEGTAWYGL